MENINLQLPCKNDHFGYRHGNRDELGRLHPGDDYNGPGAGDADLGIDIMACGRGVISYVGLGYNSGWGNHVFSRHNLKELLASVGLALPSWCPETIWFHYAHLKDVNVKLGQTVDLKTKIGTMGKSGSADQYSNIKGRKWTSHLHWDARNQPLGVTFYPPASMSVADFNAKYVGPTDFVARFNAYVATAKPAKDPSDTALVEAKERIKRDEEAILSLLSIIDRISKQTDVTGVLKTIPWIKK